DRRTLTRNQVCWDLRADPKIFERRLAKAQSSSEEQDFKMKAAVCAVLLLLTLYQAEALRCKYCFSNYGYELCDWDYSVTCSKFAPMCVRFLYTRRGGSFRWCATKKMCDAFENENVVCAFLLLLTLYQGTACIPLPHEAGHYRASGGTQTLLHQRRV
ncbi:unnamed protein product, partial [Pleuronectes platessa]